MKILAGIISVLLLATGVRADAGDGGNGTISLYTYYHKERRAVTYLEGDKVRPEGVREIERLFRTRDSESEHPVDLKLLKLLDQIEDHFGVRQIEIICGYRSEEFNKALKKAGHNVANESFHVKGMAADIHLDEITEEALRDYALSLKAGGVGFYANLDMVHVDVGPVRTWGEAGQRKAWIGEKNEAFPLTATVTPTRTLNQSLESLTLEPGPGANVYIKPDIAIELFDGGEWKNQGVITVDLWACDRPLTSPQKIPLKELGDFRKLPFGKFRFRVEACDGKSSQYSNEYYFKKR